MAPLPQGMMGQPDPTLQPQTLVRTHEPILPPWIRSLTSAELEMLTGGFRAVQQPAQQWAAPQQEWAPQPGPQRPPQSQQPESTTPL